MFLVRSAQPAYAERVSARKSFRAILEAGRPSGLNWTIARVPFHPADVWPVRNRLRVKGTINGFSFRTSLFGSSQDGHVLLVNKTMQKAAGATLGSMVDLVLEPDLEERTATIPVELTKILKQDRALKQWFAELNYSARKDIGNWISSVKNPDIRARRAEQVAERMLLAMEGERELPPILQVAFRRQPLAQQGWEVMTPIQRRGHLLGIFYYQSPEAREKRAKKAVEEALKIAKAITSE